MNELNTTVFEEEDWMCSYEEFAADIATVLEFDYHLTPEQAEEAVQMASQPLRSAFELDPEMALHISYEHWAEDVLDYWRRHKL